MEVKWQKFIDKFENLKIGQHPNVDKWFLMGSPTPIICITISYILFVLVIGPKFMKNRPPFELNKIIIGYNAVQIFLSGYMLSLTFQSAYFLDYFFGFGCTKVSTTEDNHFISTLHQAIWIYMIAKISDLLDTCFFVLRKKMSNISFLHLYHHVGILIFTWCCLKYTNGQECMVVGLLNCAVHVVMYFYYLIAALGPKYRKYLWWKKYLTILQLVQFGYIFVHMAFSAFLSCHWNKVAIYGIMLNSVVHTLLFLNFYKNTYKNMKKVEVNNNDKKKD